MSATMEGIIESIVRRVVREELAAFKAPSSSAGADRTLTARQTAELLGVATITLAQWRARGDGPPHFKVGRRHVRYRRADVDAWMATRARGKVVQK